MGDIWCWLWHRGRGRWYVFEISRLVERPNDQPAVCRRRFRWWVRCGRQKYDWERAIKPVSADGGESIMALRDRYEEAARDVSKSLGQLCLARVSLIDRPEDEEAARLCDALTDLLDTIQAKRDRLPVEAEPAF